MFIATAKEKKIDAILLHQTHHPEHPGQRQRNADSKGVNACNKKKRKQTKRQKTSNLPDRTTPLRP